MLRVLPDVPEVADPDPHAVAAVSERARRDFRQRPQDRVEARRPHAAHELADEAEVHKQVVVDRLRTRDRRDLARFVRQLGELGANRPGSVKRLSVKPLP